MKSCDHAGSRPDHLVLDVQALDGLLDRDVVDDNVRGVPLLQELLLGILCTLLRMAQIDLAVLSQSPRRPQGARVHRDKHQPGKWNSQNRNNPANVSPGRQSNNNDNGDF